MLLLGYGYKGNNLARLGGYPAHQNVAMSDFFYFDFVFIWLRRGVGGGRGGAGDGLTEI